MAEIDLLEELNSLSKNHELQRSEIDQIMIEFAGRITKALHIERMSVWLFQPNSEVIVSMGEYDSRDESFEKDNTFSITTCPEYFEALGKDELLYVADVHNSEITAALEDIYNIPNDIITRLDIPLRFEGQMIGVMCFEKTGEWIKVFDSKERFFAQAISMVFSSNLEARKRRALQVELDRELREKETLLKEIHHRVKNNLSVVSSLIKLQSSKAKDAYHVQLLDDCWGKVQSIADIHDIVYQSNAFANINVHDYFTKLLLEVLQFYGGDEKHISINFDIDDFELSIQSLIPLGLIVNEVVTNAFKHAFQDSEEGVVQFILKKDQDVIKMNIIDNGKGMEESEQNAEKLGMEIIKDLADQIDASFHFYSDESGLTFHLQAPLHR